MKKALFMSFVALATTCFAAGNAFEVNLTKDSIVEGKTLKAGKYKVWMENGNAVLKQGKQTIEVPAHEVSEADKADSNTLIYSHDTELQEILVGGTHTKIVFGGNAADRAGM